MVKQLFQIESFMKLLKNLGWFLLAILSFYFGYGLVQSMALSALDLGLQSLSLATLYPPVRGLCLWSLQMVSRQKRLASRRRFFNRYIWLPTLVLLVAITAQFFLPEDPSVNQQIVSQLTVAQPVFGFFMVVVFAPVTEELYL